VLFLEQVGEEGVSVADGDRFLAWDGGALVEEVADPKARHIGLGKRLDVDAVEAEGTSMKAGSKGSSKARVSSRCKAKSATL